MGHLYQQYQLILERSKADPRDVKFISELLPNYTKHALTFKTKQVKERFIAQLEAAGIPSMRLAGKTIQELIALAKKHDIKLVMTFKRGRKAVPADPEEVKALLQLSPDIDQAKDLRPAIKKKKSQLIKKLEHDEKLAAAADGKSLGELVQLLKKHNISTDEPTARKRDWMQFEDDVTEGINELFKTGFFISDSRSGKKPIVDKDNESYKAERIGGSNKSDVMVAHGKQQFYVECKLNFNTAEYFKFGIQINDYKLHYNHHHFISKNAEGSAEAKEMDDLFKNKINLPKILNDIVNEPQVVNSWKKFKDNLIDLKTQLQANSEFKDFTGKIKLNSFPEDFKSLTEVFDKYIKFYAAKYANLATQIISKCIIPARDSFKASDLKKFFLLNIELSSHVKNTDFGSVFEAISDLNELIELHEYKFKNQKEYETLISQIRLIEIKFITLLQKLGKDPSDVTQLNKLEEKEKLMYFFKLFISSVGRKQQGQATNSLAEVDELGNMQICSSLDITTDVLSKAITDYYVVHGKCAYIQIDDQVYQFDKKLNPFNIKSLPIFSEIMTHYSVMLTVTDDLSGIRLHIRSFKPEASQLSRYSKVSFRKKDSCYIAKKLKNIEIKMK